jgi:hypothetical protein
VTQPGLIKSHASPFPGGADIHGPYQHGGIFPAVNGGGKIFSPPLVVDVQPGYKIGTFHVASLSRCDTFLSPDGRLHLLDSAVCATSFLQVHGALSHSRDTQLRTRDHDFDFSGSLLSNI